VLRERGLERARERVKVHRIRCAYRGNLRRGGTAPDAPKPVMHAYGEGTEAQDAGEVQAGLHNRDAGLDSVVGWDTTPAGLGQRHRVDRTGLD
jgi:hypothetical protein